MTLQEKQRWVIDDLRAELVQAFADGDEAWQRKLNRKIREMEDAQQS